MCVCDLITKILWIEKFRRDEYEECQIVNVVDELPKRFRILGQHVIRWSNTAHFLLGTILMDFMNGFRNDRPHELIFEDCVKITNFSIQFTFCVLVFVVFFVSHFSFQQWATIDNTNKQTVCERVCAKKWLAMSSHRTNLCEIYIRVVWRPGKSVEPKKKNTNWIFLFYS